MLIDGSNHIRVPVPYIRCVQSAMSIFIAWISIEFAYHLSMTLTNCGAQTVRIIIRFNPFARNVLKQKKHSKFHLLFISHGIAIGMVRKISYWIRYWNQFNIQLDIVSVYGFTRKMWIAWCLRFLVFISCTNFPFHLHSCHPLHIRSVTNFNISGF